MRFSRSIYLVMFLSLETLMSIIKTGTPVLAELIDLVNSVIIFQSQMTLLRWLTFRHGSLALFELFLSSDASICSTMAFPELANSDLVVSVSINFPINSKQDDLF